MPETLQVVTLEQLQALADTVPVEPPSNGRKINVQRWIDKFKVPVSSSKPWNGGKVFIINPCPWNAEHTNGSAYIVQFASGAIAAGCHHDSCNGNGWAELRDVYEPDWRENEPQPRESQADLILKEIGDIELFHDNLNRGYARIDNNGHVETWSVKSDQFSLWLQHQYYSKKNKVASPEAIKTVQNMYRARARFDAEEKNVELRVAKFEDAIWYDLADEDWRSVKVTPDGWSIEAAPSFFRRYGTTASQFEPRRNGNLHRLLDFVNFKDSKDAAKTDQKPDQRADQDEKVQKDEKVQDERNQIEANRALFLIYPVTCLVPGIPHPLVIFHGEKGAAKTTAMRVMRRVVDPSGLDLIDMPQSLQDLAIVLSHNYMPSFDNLDSLQGRQSNLLCSACTGGGISKRELYSDEDEIVLSFKRCVTLNGINVVASRADLLDRSILFELERIEKENRKEESVFWREFEEALPDILGGLFDTLSKAMAIYPTLVLRDLPRMADFARWGYAVAEALGIGGDKFLEYYLQNINIANQEAINANPIATAIVAFMDSTRKNKWEGTMSALHNELGGVALVEHIDISPSNRAWPKSSSTLSRRLKPIKSNLLDVGISVEMYTSTSGKNKNCSMVKLECLGNVAKKEAPKTDYIQGERVPFPLPALDGTTFEIPAHVLEPDEDATLPTTSLTEPKPSLQDGTSSSWGDDWEEKDAARLKKLMEDTEF